MLILVCGNIGSGKTTIARALAKKLGGAYLDADRFKRTVYRQDPDFEKNMREGIPFSDRTRLRLYKKIIERLARYPAGQTIIVDEVMPKRVFRTMLKNAARKQGRKCVTVWVRTSNAQAEARLRKIRSQHMLAVRTALAMRRELNSSFEPAKEAEIKIWNNKSPAQVQKILMNKFKRLEK